MTHLTRHYMYNHIRTCLDQHKLLPITGNILGISGITNFYNFMDMKRILLTEENYPEIDMQNMPYDENTFDFVISDQVIEHLEDPMLALNESHRVLKIGGIAIHTTCFLNYIHFCPQDLWR
ncbi:MAG: class I SAM-dependent methyltransferase, partial [Dehalococcoidia bacterium]